MPTTTKTKFFAIIFSFSFLTGCAGRNAKLQTPSAPAPKVSAEVTLQQKLDEVAGKTMPVEKEKKTKTTKPAKTPMLDPADPNLSAHDRKVALLARELELRKELKKVEEEKKKSFTPVEKKADEIVGKQEDRQKKIDNEVARISRDASITGCPANTVWVSQEAEPPNWVTKIYQSAVVRIVNTSAMTIDEISGPTGIMVRNLCPRGTVTIKVFLGMLDSDQIQVPLMAIARPQDGGIATAPFTVSLYRWNYYQRVDNQIWYVNPQRQQQTR